MLIEALLFMAFMALFLTFNYLVFAFGGHWFFYHYLGPKIPHRRIVENEASYSQIQNEKRRSIHTQMMFMGLALVIFGLHRAGFTQIYTKVDEKGYLYFSLSVLIMHQLHDAYFYWTHRLMHQWKPLQKYHFVHHESAPPTPYSSLAFHPIEAFIQGLYWVIISLTLPIHIYWLFAFYSFMFYINMWGHTSYEFWHKDLLTHKILKHLNTPTHHNLHHKYHKANFSIYYNFWDKLCGTNHPEYENHYRTVKAKTELNKTSRIMKMMKL
jgi:Delta7-sterol 5-desaturase